MDSPYQKELLVCFDAIQAAADISRDVLASKDQGVLEKDDLSPVTVADFAIQALLTATLHVAFPEDQFVGEETAAALKAAPALLHRVWTLLQDSGPGLTARYPHVRVPESQDAMCDMLDWCGLGVPPAVGGGRAWVFDPIDGTATYVRGQLYAVNVCLIHDGTQQVAAVALPLLAADAQYPVFDHSIDPSGAGCILFGVRGHGAYARPLSGRAEDVTPRRLPAIPPTPSVAALRSVTCYDKLASGVEDIHQAIIEGLGVPFPGCDVLGWVPRWSVLALGLATVTVWVYRRRDRLAKIWDHAGAMLLFEETGGRITDVDGRDIDLTAGRTLKRNFGFVAAPADVHAEVVAAVRRTIAEQGREDLLVARPE